MSFDFFFWFFFLIFLIYLIYLIFLFFLIFLIFLIFWFFWFFDFLIFFLFYFTLNFSFLIPAQTGNRIISICVHNDKLPVIFVSRTLTVIEVGCMQNFWINQRLEKNQILWFFWLFDYFRKICLRSYMTEKNQKYQIIKFDSFDFLIILMLKKFLKTDR